jgi:ribosomal protein L12E/L44/L45/RPP1/RPP2
MNLKSVVPLLTLILAVGLLACAAPAPAPAQSTALPKQDVTPREVEEEADTPEIEPQHKDQLFGLYPAQESMVH